MKSKKSLGLLEEIKTYFVERGAKNVLVIVQGTTCTIHLSKMYQGLGKLISFQNLNWLAYLLGTEKIDLENDTYTPGCESCDWGSQHSVDIVCRDIKV